MVDEPAVVTGDNQRTFPLVQRIFQGLHTVEVEEIGRLIDDEDGRG